MPVKISDSQLSTAYTALQNARKSDPNVKIDDSSVLKLLAAVGDGHSGSSSSILTKISAPGMTRQQQFDVVSKGLSKTEKKDLGTILDQGDVPLTASAKNFLEALVGRATLDGGQPALAFSFDPKKGINGAGMPAGVTVEAIDLSTAPGGRLHLEDTVEVGKTDQFGKFMGTSTGSDFMKGVQEGDVIRYRTRDASGKASDWVTTTAHTEGAAAADTRNALVAMQRIVLSDAGSGKISVANMESRPISEPGAKLQFTNVRSGEKTVVTLDANGTFPSSLKINGKAGDTFSVSASDGKNNLGFTQSLGTINVAGSTTGGGGKIDLPDPKLHKDQINKDGTPQYTTQRFTGPLFKDGVNFEDVVQGYLGDCYCPSGFSALAKANPDYIKNAIKDNGDGTYTVTFKQRDWQTGTYKPVEVKVDGDLYARSWGGPLYGASSGDRSTSGMELWFPLMEKAWAVWKGGSEGYNGVGNGGLSSDIFEAILGKRGVDTDIGSNSASTIFADVKRAIDGHLPISAGTYGDDQQAKYTNTGVYADHSYSVVGYKTENGVNYVQLRNPWGESEPAGDGKNDGIFYLPMDKFMSLYQTLMTVQG